MNRLVVASYNIHRGVGLDRRRDLDRIAAVVGEMEPDVVGLQEVICENGADHRDQAAYVASKLGLSLVMGETRDLIDGGKYGNAVLSRLPVLGWSRCDLSWRAREPRGCMRVDLGVNGTALHVFNCHFGLALRERRDQLRVLTDFIKDAKTLAGPRVLMGDFNEWHTGPITKGLKREFTSPMRRMRRTHPAWFPLFALDRIYWDVELEGQEFHVHRSKLSRVASDHLPVSVTLRVRHPVAHAVPYVVGEALAPPE
ncbi:MAG: endonuclease/exonuclease/phosphatase family protein [Candidatus Rokubacteria bacterium]|nr:endonuclease/exonuclease/phosphatase family protein [Candidatus Rokubacteria bacterium]